MKYLTLLAVAALFACAALVPVAGHGDEPEPPAGGATDEPWTISLNPHLSLQGMVDGDVLTLTVKLTASAWVGIGFSSSGKMVGSYAVVARGGIAQEVYLGGQSVVAVTATSPKQIFNESYSQANGITTLTFSRNLNVGSTRPVLDPNAFTGIIWAYGSDNTFAEHVKDGYLLVQLATGKSEFRVTTLFALHAIGMWLAWGLLQPVGAIIAGSGWTRRKEPASGPKAWWFQRHYMLQTFGAFIALGSWVLSFIQVQKFEGHHAEGLHGIAGYCILGAMVLQVLGGFLRAPLNSPRRVYWTWFHRILGSTLCIVAVLQMVLGLSMIAQTGFLIAVAIIGGLMIVAFIVGRFFTGPRTDPKGQYKPEGIEIQNPLPAAKQ